MNYKVSDYELSLLAYMVLSFFCVSFFGIDFAFAEDAQPARDPISSVLCNVANLFTGNLGVAIATGAIIFVGIGFIMGKTSWGILFATTGGIAIIFGAQPLVGMIQGRDAETVCVGTGV